MPPVVEGDWSAASGYAAGRELADDSAVTGVFAAGDEMARDPDPCVVGGRLPQDISVVGFEGMPVAA
ncbi:hypothetical protein GCM10027072_73480 [Streptomyces bullii]